MIRLHTRIMLGFLCLVVVPIGGGGMYLHSRIQEQFHADFVAGVERAQSTVRRRLERDVELLSAHVSGVMVTPQITELLQDLAHGRLTGNVDGVRALQRQAEALRQAANLDSLWIIDFESGNKVLASPHAPLGAKPAKALLSLGLDHQIAPLIVRERINRGGTTVWKTLIAAGKRTKQLLIVGGRVIGSSLARDLRLGGLNETDVSLLDEKNQLLASTLGQSKRDLAGYVTAEVPQMNPGQTKAALTVQIHVSKRPLEERIQTLINSLLAVGCVAALLSWLLGSMIARRISRPVGVLAAAARQIADGARDLQLPKAQRDEIGELIEAFQQMTEQLSESERQLRRAERVAAWQEIARELAHEIKNPLTPVQMAIETVRRAHQRKHERFDELFEESTLTILEEVDRLKSIVSEFSNFARLPRPNPRTAQLNDVVRQAVILFRENDEGVTLCEELDPELGDQQLDPERMTQVVQNLIKNAIQATTVSDRPGVVTVKTKRESDGAVELVVEDNGCGIPQSELERVFNPYFTNKAGGTGLGLAVVHRIVTGHDGRVGVSSKVGEGTRFVVQLPASSVNPSTQ